MSIECEEKLLLTGAGFTKNFGTPLASEMWSWIFNYPLTQKQRKVRSQMLGDFDFENIYYKIIDGSFSEDDKQAIKKAVDAAYTRLDSIIRRYNNGKTIGISLRGVQRLINKFAPHDKQSFIFTVNQDLFLERQYYNGKRLHIPGLSQNRSWFTTSFKHKIQSPHYIKLPNHDQLEEVKEHELNQKRFNYLKLHGSYSWLDAEGSDAMVIGRGKEVRIQKEPLLRWYMEVFEEALLQTDRRLLAIGYGFRDEHINSVLVQALRKYNLSLHVIAPTEPKDFKSYLFDGEDIKPEGRVIWNNLSGYYPFRLDEIYNLQEEMTEAAWSLHEQFFGEQLRAD